MALETGTFISELVPTNPVGSDPLAFADDHLRLLKSTIKNTFPNISGAVTRNHTDINNLATQTNLTSLETSLTAAIASAMASTKDALYPVGSIYVNATSGTNPATLLGFGTWAEFGVGRVMVGQDTSLTAFNVLEETGGSANAVVVEHSHTGTTNDAGSHNHTVAIPYDGADAGWPDGAAGNISDQSSTTSTAPNHAHSFTTNSTGIGGANANLQPYIVVKMWKRTA